MDVMDKKQEQQKKRARLLKDLKSSAKRRRNEALSTGKLKAASWDGLPSKKKKRQDGKNECRKSLDEMTD